MTIKQVIIGTVVGGTIVGVAVLRIRKEKLTNETPTLVASLRKEAAQRKHLGSPEAEQASRKLLG